MTPTNEQLKDLLAKVTPGDWLEEDGWIVGNEGCDPICMIEHGGITDVSPTSRHDATLIALAPTLAAEVVRLRNAVEDALACLQFEINPSNYDHDDACRLNDNSCEAYAILAESICMGNGHAVQALDPTSDA